MIKLSKYHLFIIEIKQCGSTQYVYVMKTLWKVVIIHFLNNGLCYLKYKRYYWEAHLKMQRKSKFRNLTQDSKVFLSCFLLFSFSAIVFPVCFLHHVEIILSYFRHIFLPWYRCTSSRRGKSFPGLTNQFQGIFIDPVWFPRPPLGQSSWLGQCGTGDNEWNYAIYVTATLPQWCGIITALDNT